MTLTVALTQCERFYGAAWAWQPARWGTTDGGVPWQVVWVGWRAMQAIQAVERLSMARAISLALADGDAGVRARRDELWAAFPDDDAPSADPEVTP